MKDVWLIAALAENNVIGNGNALPWHIPEDLARFKALTMGHTLIMGRKTFESIGRTLPGRKTVVLTRRAGFGPPGVAVAKDRDEAMALATSDPVFVAGGAEIYALFLPVATRLYLTRVHGSYEGDTYFPPFDAAQWTLIASEPGSACTFEILERR